MAFDDTPANDGTILSLWKGPVPDPRYHPAELSRLDVMLALDLKAKGVPLQDISKQTGMAEADIRRIVAYREPVINPTTGAIFNPRPPGGLMGIAKVVAERWGTTVSILRNGTSRQKVNSWPRQEFMWRARSYVFPAGTNAYNDHVYPFPQIGRWFRNPMDHTTILHGVRAFEARLLSGEIEAYRTQINPPPLPGELIAFDDATGMREP